MARLICGGLKALAPFSRPYPARLRMARLLRRGRGQLGRRLEGSGPHSLQVHAARRRYSFLAPIGDRWRLHSAQAGDGYGATQRVDNLGVGVFSVHSKIIRLALNLVKTCLMKLKGIPIHFPLRIAE